MSSDQKSVLLILPDHDLRVQARKILEEKFGLFLFSVGNPVEGLATLHKIKAPSVVLLSDELPIITAREFIELKDQTDEFAKIPIVMISRNPNASAPPGACAVIRIPFDLDQFREIVKKHCGVDLGGAGSQ